MYDYRWEEYEKEIKGLEFQNRRLIDSFDENDNKVY